MLILDVYPLRSHVCRRGKPPENTFQGHVFSGSVNYVAVPVYQQFIHFYFYFYFNQKIEKDDYQKIFFAVILAVLMHKFLNYLLFFRF